MKHSLSEPETGNGFFDSPTAAALWIMRQNPQKMDRVTPEIIKQCLKDAQDDNWDAVQKFVGRTGIAFDRIGFVEYLAASCGVKLDESLAKIADELEVSRHRGFDLLNQQELIAAGVNSN